MTLDHLLPAAPAWTENAACIDESPDLFFPATGETVGPARAVCARCDVQIKCLDYAMKIEGRIGRNSRFGVYGGTSPEQRAELARWVA